MLILCHCTTLKKLFKVKGKLHMYIGRYLINSDDPRTYQSNLVPTDQIYDFHVGVLVTCQIYFTLEII